MIPGRGCSPAQAGLRAKQPNLIFSLIKSALVMCQEAAGCQPLSERLPWPALGGRKKEGEGEAVIDRDMEREALRDSETDLGERKRGPQESELVCVRGR